MTQLSMYARVAGADVIAHLEQLARPLKGMKVVHVSSTYLGGGVAEILTKVVPLSQELGLDTEWLVIDGTEPFPFFQCTKMLHNAAPSTIPDHPQHRPSLGQEPRARAAGDRGSAGAAPD